MGPDPDAERDADDLEAWWARYRIECPDCDGCGWVEGGAALKTTCATCGGTGVVEDRTGMESTVGRPASSRVAEKHGEISPVSSATTSTPAPRPEALTGEAPIGERIWKCPACDGTGLVSRPPWIAGDVIAWTTADPFATYDCRACSGRGLIFERALAAVERAS